MFSFHLAPWQVEILDAPYDPEVASVVGMLASQTSGKTETINNMVGHTIDVDPCPMLVIQPTLDMGETWSKDRLATMLRDTPRLRGKVKDPRARDAENKILHKRFPAGAITIAGANAPQGLASRPIRKVLFDEVDRYPASAGTEGDPIALAEKRTESFPDAVTIKFSTPTLKGISRIESEFDLSDKRFWFVTHKPCGHEFHFKWAHVKWSESDKKDAWIECPNCQQKILDDERQEMVRAGKWKATAPFDGIRGYHLNGIYCLFRPKKPHKNRLSQMVAEFLKAKHGGTEKLKVWTNTFLAETWEDPSGEKPSWETLFDRREDYGGEDQNNPIIPADAFLLLCVVDVQADRLEMEVTAYGMDDEVWGIETRQLWGNPQRLEVWKQLDEYLNKVYTHESGAKLRIVQTVIDNGDGKTSKAVNSFVRPRQVQKVWAVKGSSTPNAPILATAKLSKKSRVQQFTVGTDTAKSTIYARLNILEPGARYMHFPKGFGYDAEYFKQLTAESVRTEYRKGIPVRTWKKDRERNESLDKRVYAMANYEILNPNMAAVAANFQKQLPKPKEYQLKDAQEKKPETKPVQTVTRPSFRKQFRPRESGGWRR
jgi:phage terminase large subunit GpA-like protein